MPLIFVITSTIISNTSQWISLMGFCLLRASFRSFVGWPECVRNTWSHVQRLPSSKGSKGKTYAAVSSAPSWLIDLCKQLLGNWETVSLNRMILWPVHFLPVDKDLVFNTFSIMKANKMWTQLPEWSPSTRLILNVSVLCVFRIQKATVSLRTFHPASDPCFDEFLLDTSREETLLKEMCFGGGTLIQLNGVRSAYKYNVYCDPDTDAKQANSIL